MKKVIYLLAIVVMSFAAMSCSSQSLLQKEMKKEYKNKISEYKSGKWKLYGSSRTLEVALLLHYDKLNKLGENGREIVGIAPRFMSKNAGHQQAINNACITYAQQAGSAVKGRIASDLGGNGDDTSAEFDHFYAAYERLVDKEIKGEMQESFSVIKEIGKNKDGKVEYELQTFFIIDEAAASRARIRAYEAAAKESEVAQKYGKQISDYVRAGFKE